MLVAVPSRSGRNTPLGMTVPSLLNTSPSPQGRVGTRPTSPRHLLVCRVAVPSRSGRDVSDEVYLPMGCTVAVPSRSGRNHCGYEALIATLLRRRPLKVGSEHSAGDDSSFVVEHIAVPSRSGRNKTHKSSAFTCLPSRRPLKVGSGPDSHPNLWAAIAVSPSPQGRVKLSCGLSVES